jgi:hypothetical protein
VQKLSDTIDYQGIKIPVIKGRPKEGDISGTPEPIKVCYSYVNDQPFQNWLNSTNAQIYLHLGVDLDSPRNCISLVSEARRDIEFDADAYNDHDTPKNPRHHTRLYPNLDEYSLQTSFDLSTVRNNLIKRFNSGVTLKGCSTSPIKLSFRVSDDAGKFLCDYLYYVSLNLATSDERKFPKNVLLVHIPDTLVLTESDGSTVSCEKNQLKNIKAEALAEVIEFIVKELLAQINNKARTPIVSTV